MKKIIKIGSKELTIQSSAFTQFKYKNDTGRKFLPDLQNLVTLVDKGQDEQIAEVDHLLDVLLRITYVMAGEADPNQITTYEDFLKSLDDLFSDNTWIKDVVEVASAPIYRRVQGN